MKPLIDLVVNHERARGFSFTGKRPAASSQQASNKVQRERGGRRQE
jgi:hypothetical protein